jgi:methylglutaconyl-CoA hydratase
MHGPVALQIDGRGVATVTLDRPEIHNAFDDAMIAALNDIIGRIAHNDAVSIMILQGSGRSFSAGADLHWMRRSAAYTPDENLADAQALARLMHALHHLPKPTIALVQGAAFGGGVGLVACCDIAVATTEAKFSLSEVRLGLIPAVISPYVIASIGARQARRYFQTGEVFTAATAARIGLVHETVEQSALAATRDELIGHLLRGGAQAKAAAKALIDEVSGRALDQALGRRTAELIAQQRASAEAREGLAAFLEKRAPSWRLD